mmetsp:Transcript_55062/g.154908  ORF Transcript_55062/g.154908 Transcript_55062/m.154908 type:complete len:223 (-) Transcript_55062:153-821(-)
MSAQVLLSRPTSSIISPPKRNGGAPRRSSARPHRKPMPVGPHILWPLPTSQSTPNCFTSTGMFGMLWQASTRTLAPNRCARSATYSIGLMQPSTLETWHMATSLVRSLSRPSSPSTSITPELVTPTNRSLAPTSAASCCHGTRLEWCSMTVSRISSPALIFALAQVRATKLMASVAFRVNTTSAGSPAPMKLATFARAPSKASVERIARVCMPRCTLLLSRL